LALTASGDLEVEPIAWGESECIPDVGRDDDPTLLTENQCGIH
jgi:hypothetical protein